MPKFDRAKLLDQMSYGFSPETIISTIEQNNRINALWWNQWTSRLEENAERIKSLPSIESIYGSRKGPCIVCGAGPSLKTNLSIVADAFQRGISIISVDRAFKTLKGANITPDITVCYDSQKQVSGFIDGCGENDTVAISVNCHPEVFKKAEGATVFIHGPLNPFSAFWQLAYRKYGEQIATCRAGYIVSFTAVDMALWAGYNPIISIGNDLCFPNAEALHREVGGAWKALECSSHPGDTRRTHETFARSARAFALFPMWHKEIDFIDCSGGIIVDWKHERPEYINTINKRKEVA